MNDAMLGRSGNRIQDALLSKPFLLVCCGIALLVRVVWVWAIEIGIVGDGEWFLAKGVDLAAGHGYVVRDQSFPLDESNPRVVPGTMEPTAFWPVGYPAFLGGLFFAFGNLLPPLWLAKASNIVLYLGLIALAYWCSKRIFRSELAARITALILSLYPNHIAYTSLVTAEILFGCLLFGGTLLLLRERSGSHAHTGVQMVAVGMVFAAATLTKSQTVVMPAMLLTVLYWDDMRGLLTRSIVVYATLALLLAPWVYRNYIVFDSVFFISNNSGVNLLIGNNPDANGTYLWNDRLTALATSVDGERNRDELLGDTATAYIHDNPARALALLPRKVFYLLASDIDGFGWNRLGSQSIQQPAVWTLLRVVAEVVYLLVFALFFVSLWQRRANFKRYHLLGPSFLLLLMFVYLPFFGASRYHFPLVPWLAIHAGAALERMFAPMAARSSVERQLDSTVSA